VPRRQGVCIAGPNGARAAEFTFISIWGDWAGGEADVGLRIRMYHKRRPAMIAMSASQACVRHTFPLGHLNNDAMDFRMITVILFEHKKDFFADLSVSVSFCLVSDFCFVFATPATPQLCKCRGVEWARTLI
jgi:hypothetical protein